MEWDEFANKINGEYVDKPNGFLGGDTILKLIKKEGNAEQIRIQKKIRRSYEASSHYNVEKFEIEYSIKNKNFGKTRLTRKKILGRIGRKIQNQYKIEGDNSKYLSELMQLKEFKYLLKYPKAEFIILNNTLKFKSQSLGQMKEELEKVFNSFKILKNKMNNE